MEMTDAGVAAWRGDPCCTGSFTAEIGQWLNAGGTDGLEDAADADAEQPERDERSESGESGQEYAARPGWQVRENEVAAAAQPELAGWFEPAGRTLELTPGSDADEPAARGELWRAPSRRSAVGDSPDDGSQSANTGNAGRERVRAVEAGRIAVPAIEAAQAVEAADSWVARPRMPGVPPPVSPDVDPGGARIGRAAPRGDQAVAAGADERAGPRVAGLPLDGHRRVLRAAAAGNAAQGPVAGGVSSGLREGELPVAAFALRRPFAPGDRAERAAGTSTGEAVERLGAADRLVGVHAKLPDAGRQAPKGTLAEIRLSDGDARGAGPEVGRMQVGVGGPEGEPESILEILQERLGRVGGDAERPELTEAGAKAESSKVDHAGGEPSFRSIDHAGSQTRGLGAMRQPAASEPLVRPNAFSAQSEELVEGRGAIRELRLMVEAGPGKHVSLRFVEQGGSVHVAARTPDARLAEVLRADLGEMKAQGYEDLTAGPRLALKAAEVPREEAARDARQGGESGQGQGAEEDSGGGEERGGLERWLAALDRQGLTGWREGEGAKK